MESLDSVFVRTEQKKPTFELTTELTVSRKVYDYFLGQNTSLEFEITHALDTKVRSFFSQRLLPRNARDKVRCFNRKGNDENYF